MGILKRGAGILVSGLFALTLLPLNFLASNVKAAEGELPKYLEYDQKTLQIAAQYKDVSILGYYDNDHINGVMERVQGDTKKTLDIGNAVYMYNGYVPATKGIYSVEDDKVIISNDEIYNNLENKLKEHYNLNNKNLNIDPDINEIVNVDKCKGLWIYYNFNVDQKNYKGIRTPNNVFIDITDDVEYSFVDNSGLWTYSTVYNDESEEVSHVLTNYDSCGNKKVYNLQSGYFGNAKAAIESGNKMYITFEMNNELTTYKYDLCQSGTISGVQVADFDASKVSKDDCGNLWRAKDGFVEKYACDKWEKVYEVDNRMDRISVYDENHMLVVGQLNPEKLSIAEQIYTIINRDDNNNGNNGSGGDNGNGGNNNGNNGEASNPVIVDNGEDTNGDKLVQVQKIGNKDGVNTINVATKDSDQGISLEILDIDSIKNGTGSLEVKSQGVNLSIPFGAIDKTLLESGAKIQLDITVDKNSDITKGFKAINKVYNFDLTVVNGDKKTKIHNFKDGSAEISLVLSDEELKALDKDKLGVFYYNEETKKFELMETRVEGNNVVFKTPHFSKFIVAEKSTINGQVLPKTGSIISTEVLMGLGLMAVALGALLVRRKSVKSVK